MLKLSQSTMIEQLAQVVESYPVLAGDLVSKVAKNELAALGLIEYRAGRLPSIAEPGDEKNPERTRRVFHASDAERLGGYAPTEEGIAEYQRLCAECPQIAERNRNRHK